jgi:hypothetical protein
MISVPDTRGGLSRIRYKLRANDIRVSCLRMAPKSDSWQHPWFTSIESTKLLVPATIR